MNRSAHPSIHQEWHWTAFAILAMFWRIVTKIQRHKDTNCLRRQFSHNAGVSSKHCIYWSICFLQPDGARAVWGDISRPQVPHERLISCYTAPLLHFFAAACEEKTTSLPLHLIFQKKTFSCYNVVELLSSQDIVRVEFLNSNVTCLLFETTFARMCFMSQFLNELKCDPSGFRNMVGAPCRREYNGGEGANLECSQPHPCGVQGCSSSEHSYVNSISSQEGDPMGKLFAIYSLLPLVIVIIFATTFFIRFLLLNLSYL